MNSQSHQQFSYTPEGLQNARKWAEQQGRLEELDARGNGFSTDGYSQVYQCNVWYNRINNKKQ